MRRPQSETEPVPTKASQSPLRIRSNVLLQLKALDKDVVANHNDHHECRSEAQPGDVVHHGDMVPEGEAQPDNPGQLVLLEWTPKAKKQKQERQAGLTLEVQRPTSKG